MHTHKHADAHTHKHADTRLARAHKHADTRLARAHTHKHSLRSCNYVLEVPKYVRGPRIRVLCNVN